MESAFISRSSRLASDPLSDVLSLLSPRGFMSGGIDAGGDWAIDFGPDPYFRCFAIVSGMCWLAVDNAADALCLDEGDVVVLPHGHAFRLASDLAVPPVDIMSVITGPLNGGVLRWQDGGACMALSALFSFASSDVGMLVGVLPPVLHIRADQDGAAMRWYIERMMRVIREPQPGGVLLGEHLAQMMLVEVLGIATRETTISGLGWLSALADRQVSAAITAIHEQPAHPWTLDSLARRIGMSRSAFAARFKAKVGIPAMQYLLRWRMHRAAHQLLNTRESVSSIALSLGYASESAFSFAFKREMGCSPRQYSEPGR